MPEAGLLGDERANPNRGCVFQPGVAGGKRRLPRDDSPKFIQPQPGLCPCRHHLRAWTQHLRRWEIRSSFTQGRLRDAAPTLGYDTQARWARFAGGRSRALQSACGRVRILENAARPRPPSSQIRVDIPSNPSTRLIHAPVPAINLDPPTIPPFSRTRFPCIPCRPRTLKPRSQAIMWRGSQ